METGRSAQDDRSECVANGSRHFRTAIDVIGDIHGDADKLEGLLTKLGYRRRNGAWRHPERTAVFVGDLIDRGPGQIRTLQIVRDMIEGGSARAVMGNHELNAIAWATPNPAGDGTYLRPRHGVKGEKNARQHAAFLSEIDADSPLHREWIDWFMDLPLWLEEPGYRVIHACWSAERAERLSPHLREGFRLTADLLADAHREGSDTFEAVDVLLKGMEVRLPAGVTFTDKEGHVRDAIRTRWWRPDLDRFRDAYIGPPGVDIPDEPLPTHHRISPPDRPTFIGHYWFDPSWPLEPAAPKVACVDFSAAKGGPLVAYRFDGEDVLSAAGFVAA